MSIKRWVGVAYFEDPQSGRELVVFGATEEGTRRDLRDRILNESTMLLWLPRFNMLTYEEGLKTVAEKWVFSVLEAEFK